MCSCLLTIRYKCPSESFLGSASDIDENASIFSVATVRRELSLGRILLLLNLFSFASGLCFAFVPGDAARYSLTGLFALLTLGVALYIGTCCGEVSSNRFVLDRDGYGAPGRRRFRTPLVPYLPALGIYMNWFMIANIGWKGIVMLALYLLVGILLYGTLCSGKSVVNRPSGEGEDEYRNRNILPRRTSPPTGSPSDLTRSLLEDDERWDENSDINAGDRKSDLKSELSEIETRETAFV